MTRLGVAVWGLGRLGQALVRELGGHPRLELVAAEGVRSGDRAALLARSDVRVLLHAGHGGPAEVRELFAACARAGTDAVTSSALFHPEHELGAEAARALDRLAAGHGARLLATGLIPGFLLDLMPAGWLSLSPGWTAVTAIRTVEAAGWGEPTLRQLGIGGPPAAVEAGAPHSLVPAMRLLAELVGAEAASVEERRAAIVATARCAGIEPGAAAGFRQTVRADLGGRRAEIAWDVAVSGAVPDRARRIGVHVRVDGREPLEVEASGGFGADPYPATAARMLHAAERIQGRPPGLLRLDQLPP